MKIHDRIAKLIDVKSIITIALVIVLCIQTINGQPTQELFNSAVMLVLGFFFGKKTTSQDEPTEETSEK